MLMYINHNLHNLFKSRNRIFEWQHRTFKWVQCYFQRTDLYYFESVLYFTSDARTKENKECCSQFLK